MISGLALAIVLMALCGCEAPRYGEVARRELPDGTVSLWAPEGILHAGPNPVVVDFTGQAAAGIDIPPRLRFRKPVSGSGYSVEREVRLRRSGPARFAGTIDFPEPGKWLGRLEAAGETWDLEIVVE
jgi:hypothetical protein